VRRPWVGAQLQQPNTRNPRDAISAGAVVATIVPGSPAQARECVVGDRVLSLDPVRSTIPMTGGRAARSARRRRREDRLMRDGQTRSVNVAIKDLPDVSASKVQVLKEARARDGYPTIAAERRLGTDQGR